MASDRPGVFFLPFSCYAAENTFSFIVQYHTAFLIFLGTLGRARIWGWDIGVSFYTCERYNRSCILVATNKMRKTSWNSGNAALEENPNQRPKYAI
jgi:hypothetical protein